MTDNPSERAIISVDEQDAEMMKVALETVLHAYDNDGIALTDLDLTHLRNWHERFAAIYHVLTSHIPIHFTDLGTVE